MKLLFDSNVLLASLVSHGLCADLVRLAAGLHDMAGISVCYCPAIEYEVMRHLQGKLGGSKAQCALAQGLFSAITRVPDGNHWQPPADFPDPDDTPIIGAALTAEADWFVTGDKALLDLGEIEGLPIRSPRDAYILLRGL